MDEQMKSLMKNKTCNLVELPLERKSIGCKWIYKAKKGANSEINIYKAGLVALGYNWC